MLKETLIVLGLVGLNGCAALAPISDDIEQMVNNDAITVKVDRDALNPKTDVKVTVEVINKDTEAK